MQDSSVLQVVIFRDGSLVGTEVFLPGAYTLGRDPGCELLLDDGAVAACHAVLTFKEGRIAIEDLSGQGVLVNGAPVVQWEIGARDDVAIGPFLIKIRPVSQKRPIPRAAPASAPAAPALAAPRPQPTAHAPVAPVRAAAPAAPTRVAPLPPPVAPAPPASSAVERMGTAIRQPAPRAAPAAVLETEDPTLESRLDTTEPGVELPALADKGLPTLQEMPALALPAAGLESVAPELPAAQPPVRPARPARVAAAAKPAAHGKKPSGPFLRVRVIWDGDYVIGLHGFAFGTLVEAGPSERCDVPLYHPAVGKPFSLATVVDGLWTVAIPPGTRAQLEGARGWEPWAGSTASLAAGKGLRLSLGRGQLLELRAEAPPPPAPMRWGDLVDARVGLPFLVAATSVLAALLMMPEPRKESADFSPKQLAPIRALLRPPDKKKEKKIQEKIAKLTNKPQKVQQDPETVAPPQKARGQVAKAVKAVERITNAGPAIESLLKATATIAGGPKGYGDKGQGFKLSPLIGKPPIPMAGMGIGPGLGGFGTQTKGLGGMRGMGGNGGGGIGTFATGGVGKGKVAGTVVSAPARKAKISGGSLPREAIAKVINEHLTEVRGCYERALLRNAGLAGKLMLEWTIDTSGRVSEIKVKTSTLKGAEVPNCIVNSLKTWTFPAPKGGRVIVSYPFLFNAVGF